MRVALLSLVALALAASVSRADTVTTYREIRWDGRQWVEVRRWQVVTPAVIQPTAPPAYPVAPAYVHPQAQPMPAGFAQPNVYTPARNYYPADPSCQTGA